MPAPLVAYGDSDDEQTDTPFNASDAFNLSGIKTSTSQGASSKNAALPVAVRSAPGVLDKDLMSTSTTMIARHEDTQMNVNMTYQDMLQPVQGPDAAHAERRLEKMNTLTGYVEAAAMSDSDFKSQQRSFYVNGYAHNPSLLGPTDEGGRQLQPFIGNVQAALSNNGAMVEELKPRRELVKATKRKRKEKGTLGYFEEEAAEEEEAGEGAADNEAAIQPEMPKEKKMKEYVGPWAGWEDDSSRAWEEGPEYEEVDEHVKRSANRPIIERSKREVGFGEEKSVFHGKNMHDYQGRTYMSIPRDTGVDLEPEEPGQQQCYIPKKCIHTWTGHTKAVSSFQLFPGSGHLLLSGSMDTRIKLWDVYGDGKCLRTFMGHAQAVRDVCFSPDGKRFLSASFDRQTKLWDTETGACLQAFSNGKIPYCVRFHPDSTKPNVFLSGMSDKKIVQYDITSGEITQEYDQHLGPVNTIMFVDEGRRFLTSSDDKSVRVWDYDIPVVIKYIADPTMHSMPAVAQSPNHKWLAYQSLDNQIMVFSTDNFKQNRKKAFRGHTVAGYACQPAFSPDGRFLSSGDGTGNVHFWDFKTGRKYPNRLHAHNQVVISQAWLPHETVRSFFLLQSMQLTVYTVEAGYRVLGWSFEAMGMHSIYMANNSSNVFCEQD